MHRGCDDVVIVRMVGVDVVVLVHRIKTVLRAAGLRLRQLQLVVHVGLDFHLNEMWFPWTCYYYVDVRVVLLTLQMMTVPIQKSHETWLCPLTQGGALKYLLHVGGDGIDATMGESCTSLRRPWHVFQTNP